MIQRLLKGLTRNRVRTSFEHSDPRLRGRRYGIPYQEVWEAALALATNGMKGWRIVSADRDAGQIRVESRTSVFRFVDDVEVRVSLDDDAQTVVHLSSASRVGKGDLGTNARRVARFFKRLDRALVRASTD